MKHEKLESNRRKGEARTEVTDSVLAGARAKFTSFRGMEHSVGSGFLDFP